MNKIIIVYPPKNSTVGIGRAKPFRRYCSRVIKLGQHKPMILVPKKTGLKDIDNFADWQIRKTLSMRQRSRKISWEIVKGKTVDEVLGQLKNP